MEIEKDSSSLSLKLHGCTLFFIPIFHYNLESTIASYKKISEIHPEAIAVEFPEFLQSHLERACERLPDISLIELETEVKSYYLIEPCDPCIEGVRWAKDHHIPFKCIDLFCSDYGEYYDPLPDCYTLNSLNLEEYYSHVEPFIKKWKSDPRDKVREEYMAKSLTEMTCKYSKVASIVGIKHIPNILQLLKAKLSFSSSSISKFPTAQLISPDENSLNQIFPQSALITKAYESWRNSPDQATPDRLQLYLELLSEAKNEYEKELNLEVPPNSLSKILNFMKRLSLQKSELTGGIYELLISAKGFVDPHYAYIVWNLAKNYPYFKNLDALSEKSLKPEEIWKHNKKVLFQIKRSHPKSKPYFKRRSLNETKENDSVGSTLCSYPPEDIAIEKLGKDVQKRACTIELEKAKQSLPFLDSLEEGIDLKETLKDAVNQGITTFQPGQSLVKHLRVKGKSPKKTGNCSVVIIFEDERLSFSPTDHFNWGMTWHGEHDQESDMAFYGTDPRKHQVGTGIWRCRYGGFLLSYPPKRLYDVWHDPEYSEVSYKSEVLLLAGIHYSLENQVVYVASKKPHPRFHKIAKAYGKKILYYPLGSLSIDQVDRLRNFHILDSYKRREGAQEFID